MGKTFWGGTKILWEALPRMPPIATGLTLHNAESESVLCNEMVSSWDDGWQWHVPEKRPVLCFLPPVCFMISYLGTLLITVILFWPKIYFFGTGPYETACGPATGRGPAVADLRIIKFRLSLFLTAEVERGDDITHSFQTLLLWRHEVIGATTGHAMQRRTPQLLCAHPLACGGLDQGGAAEEDGPLKQTMFSRFPCDPLFSVTDRISY